METQQVTVINAEGLILGRMASVIAKRLLRGENIVIVNAEKAIISGKRKSKVREAKEFLEVGAVGQGPIHYRKPDRILRRTIRGMLPHKQPKGKQAYRRLKVFIGIPDELRNYKMETIEEAQAKKLTCPYFTLGELAKEIGWEGE
ncbi:MAG: 50S ribosomal protein L13 [Candidatus Bathyarchaeota archaeon]|nr:50S ribosomal protein L13 [Candidatus Bathyarchaeota archaeon]MCX8178061.1 50S ribosomal protein L13 [Candidatus Bathyarchaeota archaeon]MDW8194330.1 50S ribosomal protein L13 [Nitrososphaerota archaeon]